jgi:hypothetical protein
VCSDQGPKTCCFSFSSLRLGVDLPVGKIYAFKPDKQGMISFFPCFWISL